MENMTGTPENIAERLKRWLTATFEAVGEAKLLASLDDETVKLLAQDNALSEQDLRDLIRKGPHAADEMPALMALLGINPEDVRLGDPSNYRDMHVACAHCGEKARCRRELADGSATQDFTEYCGNAERLADLMPRPVPQA